MFSRAAPLPIGTSVPVNIVANGPTTDTRPAEQAPIAQDARVATPVPDAKPPTPQPMARPEPAAKSPPATPTPRKPAPALKPTPIPAKPKKAFDLAAIQADVGAKRASFNLAALQADISKETKSHPAKASAAPRGETRAETAPQARIDAGAGVSQSDIAGLSQLLERLWNPDCANGARPVIPVKFTVSFDGHVQGPVDTAGRDIRTDVDARRAVDAVHQLVPFADTYRGLTYTVRFDAKKACAARN
jgi:outer membrane biosynthesis protein TonB